MTGNDGNGAQSVQLFGNTDPIGAHYAELGGSRGSYLSDPVGGEYPTAGGGMAQDFRGGAIYWSPQTGAYAVRGAILEHYKALGGPAGALDYPTSDELGTPDGVGRFNNFAGTGRSGITVHTKTGDKTLGTQRGVVTAVNAGSVTVKSTDGFTATYTLNPTTKVHKGKQTATTAQLSTNDRVRVLATKTGTTATHIGDAGPANPPHPARHRALGGNPSGAPRNRGSRALPWITGARSRP